MTERAAVRFGVPALLLASTAGAVAVSLHTAKAEIPSLAFGSHVVLAVQGALLFFYGMLLLAVPLIRALVDGALPVELTLKGARWAEDIEALGDEVSARQAKVDEKAAGADLALKEGIEVLQKELKALAKTQKGDTGDILGRIVALEKRTKPEG
jgi:hypothetical protein